MSKHRKPVKRQKKSGQKEDLALKRILLLTAILNLLRAVTDLVKELTG